jgi:hypothetical protein
MTPMKKMTSAWHPNARSFVTGLRPHARPAENATQKKTTKKKPNGTIKHESNHVVM